MRFLFVLHFVSLVLFAQRWPGEINAIPIIHYEFTEADGTANFRDLSGADNDGTCTNCPDMFKGKYDGYAQFTQGNSDFITLPSSTINSDTGTASVWMSSTYSADEAMIHYGTATNGNGLGGQDELHLYLDDGGDIRFFIEGGGSDIHLQGSVINDGEIHHVVAVWDIAANATIYLDGTSDASATHDANSFITAGLNALGAPDSAQRYYDGRLYNFILWNVALNARQVNALYWTQRRNFVRPSWIDSLMAYPVVDLLERL